jgi:circadian clock protein KaiC
MTRLWPDRETDSSLPRIGTGSAGADFVLNGGFPSNSINLITGQPGSGKTIFVEQLVFQNASADCPALYLTTLSEPMGKLVKYLQEFSFHDPSKLGSAIIYEDAGHDLAEHGPGALVPRVREAIREMSPRIIVIDSFRAIHDLSGSISETRQFVHELAGILTAYDTTAFLVGEYGESDSRIYPEFAVADSVIELSRRRLGKRDERFLSVFKLRGSRYEEGMHAFRISSDGVRVFPRLVTPPRPDTYDPVVERISTGNDRLDEMMAGGPWRGSATLVAGPSGSGKTTLALEFALNGVNAGENSLYINLQENPTQLARTIRGLGFDLDESLKRGLDLLYVSSVELEIDTIVGEVFQRVRDNNVHRLAIDAVGDIASSAGDEQRFHDYVYALIQHLATRSVTTFLTLETSGAGPLRGLSVPTLSFMCDNLIALSMDGGEERLRRTIRVIKARGTAHDLRAREFEIRDGGITIA